MLVLPWTGQLRASGIQESTGETSQLFFWVSRVTNRVHVLDDQGKPLSCNFKLADWEALKDPAAVFADALQNEPSAMRNTQAFLRQWATLKATEQRRQDLWHSLSLAA